MNPKPGLTTEVDIVRWIDADTPVVKISREFSVRLLDTDKKGQFNSPEKNTPEGQEAKLFAEEYSKEKKAYIFIPTKNSVKLMDINSFNRILAEMWIDDRKVTDVLIENGHGEIK